MKTLIISIAVAIAASAHAAPLVGCYPYTGKPLVIAGKTIGPDSGTYSTPVGDIMIATQHAEISIRPESLRWRVGKNPTIRVITVPNGLSYELLWCPENPSCLDEGHCTSLMPTRPGRYCVIAKVTEKNWSGAWIAFNGVEVLP